MVEREILKRNLEQFLDHMKELNCDCKPFIFEPPATEAEIVTVETELGYSIPSEFREVLLTISAHCEFRWFLPNDFPLSHQLRQIFSGDIHWGLKFIKNFEEQRIEWIKAVFPNPDDEYDKIWHNKFAFYEVGNGDFISVDLSEKSYGQIVYLSHDDGEGHGYVLANSFDELLRNWVKLGCVGGEDWQWLPFASSKISGIDPRSENSTLWLKTISII